jgi:uncharacterized protein
LKQKIMTDQQIIPLPDQNLVLAESGPMRLFIQAWFGENPLLKLGVEAAERSFDFLNQVAANQFILKQLPNRISVKSKDPIPRSMINSVSIMESDDLTPMAAVAGAIADAVADWLWTKKVTKVIVNNGGDIAIRLAKNETTKIGLRSNVNRQDISYTIRLKGSQHSWGINTSGLGGRSFTRGIASAVTVFAKTSTIADAAATGIANECYVNDRAIIQLPAEQLDPNTDLQGVPVTVEVGHLSEELWSKAIAQAKRKAETLVSKDIIQGAVIVADGKMVLTDDFTSAISNDFVSKREF